MSFAGCDYVMMTVVFIVVAGTPREPPNSVTASNATMRTEIISAPSYIHDAGSHQMSNSIPIADFCFHAMVLV
jgi:hypothetical protein